MLDFASDGQRYKKYVLWVAIFTGLLAGLGAFTNILDHQFSDQQWSMLTQATLETLFMVFVASLIGFIVGSNIGLFLWNKGKEGLSPSGWIYGFMRLFINSGRSIPYIIFMVLLIPLTRLVMGSSIGVAAATFPLTLGAILLFARFAEDTFKNTPKGLIEAGKVMGASKYQILYKIIFFESLPQLIAHLTNLIVMLIGFSAMAGAIGGGGVGDLAIRYGYQRYDVAFLTLIVFILIIMVQLVQMIGDAAVKRLRK